MNLNEDRTRDATASPFVDKTLELTECLRGMDLVQPDEQPVYTMIVGGVASEIWRVDLPGGPICVKRALPKLRVEQDWIVPVERGQYEVAWFRAAGRIVPHAVPKVLGVDSVRHLFAMEFIDPGTHPLWKSTLRDGFADPGFAAAVGRVLATIHASTANRPDIAAAFSSDDIFHAIRLEPYLGSTAKRHPDLAYRFNDLIRSTASMKRALVHGDVSPKNILIGPDGPVLLDAECAWYGDPAFDLAFCLNHLLLKCLWVPRIARTLLECFDSLIQAYLSRVTWEPQSDLESRAAALLPSLFLARIDGKSPVEYITSETDKNHVRSVARALLFAQPERLVTVRNAWMQELGLV